MLRLSGRAQVASLWRFNAKYSPQWLPRYLVLDSVEFLAAQGAALADAEGFADLPSLTRASRRAGARA